MDFTFLTDFFGTHYDLLCLDCLRFSSDDKDQDDFEFLCATLENQDFKTIQKYNICDNLFATLVGDEGSFSVSYFPYLKRLTAVYDPLKIGVIPPLEVKDDFTCKPKLSMITLSHDGNVPGAGMSFVITLSKGNFIVIDGGYGYNADHLFDFLSQNTPEGQKPKICGWIITHGHVDHMECLLFFKDKYADLVGVDNLIATPYYGKIVTDKLEDMLTSENIRKVCKAFGANYVLPHLGQRLYIGGAVVDIFHTAEQENAEIDWMNFASLVFMVRIGNKKIFFPTDYERRDLAPVFKNGLKCDVLQVTHHAWSGGTKEEYDYMQPEIAFFPIGEQLLTTRIAPDYSHAENHYLIGMVKQYFSDNGQDVTIEL